MARRSRFPQTVDYSRPRPGADNPEPIESPPLVSYHSYGNETSSDLQNEQSSLQGSPRPAPGKSTDSSTDPFTYEIPRDTSYRNGLPVNYDAYRLDGISSPTGEILSQVPYDVRAPPIDGDTSISYPSIGQEEVDHNNYYDVNAILAYSQLSTELQAAEDAEAAAQAAAGVIIADDSEQDQDHEYDLDSSDGLDVASIGSTTNSSVIDAGYESETGSAAVAVGGVAVSAASASITQSIRDHLFENGRRYHRFREGAYHFPNDDMEQEREDMKHTMFKLLCRHQLHFAPISCDPHEVLDMGTGTGGWAIEMGEEYPSAKVLGIDLSPIQPDWVPPNVRFMVDDIESPWLYPRNHFDYIHSRHTIMAIRDCRTLLQRCYEHTKPGGWIELQEIYHFPMSNNARMSPEHPVAQYWRFVDEGLRELGVDMGLISSRLGGSPSRDSYQQGQDQDHHDIAGLMRASGFTNIEERVFHVPVGGWAQNRMLKSVGVLWKTILLDGLQAIALRPLMRGLHWDRGQVETFLVSVRKAYHDNSCQMYMPLVCVYCQKPLA